MKISDCREAATGCLVFRPRKSRHPLRAMSAVPALFATLLAAWPAPVAAETDAMKERPFQAAPHRPTLDDPLAVWVRLAREFRERDAAQVRIEQHIIWRVTPLPGPARQSLTADDPRSVRAPRMSERKMSKCIAMSAIAGGRPQAGSRLLLFLRDRRMIAANLEKACSARDFYSGFYVDKPNTDGKLCVGRDRILARNGARCEIASFRLLVAED